MRSGAAHSHVAGRVLCRPDGAVLLAVILCSLLPSAFVCAAEQPEPVQLQVSFTPLGPDAAGDEAAGFIAALGARKGYSARACDQAPGSD